MVEKCHSLLSDDLAGDGDGDGGRAGHGRGGADAAQHDAAAGVGVAGQDVGQILDLHMSPPKKFLIHAKRAHFAYDEVRPDGRHIIGDTPRGTSTSVSHITILDYHIGTTNVKKERDFPHKMTSKVSTP